MRFGVKVLLIYWLKAEGNGALPVLCKVSFLFCNKLCFNGFVNLRVNGVRGE